MAATHTTNCIVSNAPVLYLALDLGTRDWKLAFTVGLGQAPRLKTITARSTTALMGQIKAAKKRFGLPEDAAVVSCYEAGRDGFWLHRFLLAHGVQNQVVDSSSIEVNRRQRRAKSDRLDAVKLVQRWGLRGRGLRVPGPSGSGRFPSYLGVRALTPPRVLRRGWTQSGSRACKAVYRGGERAQEAASSWVSPGAALCDRTGSFF